ncbi:MAG TPA: Gfo/Idh/MocA family oxidoreductase [Candidatus Brachybacterium merdavium]|uniref:Gfo/Idh/MocA family oxidoreductase n=1 Tax=Candidatus Brachybacterium merdavium TaxID=2838513 RepID=A0A9D2RQ23_9MICO|nr:Gfo/Idh/MocA family oxidoreductase [Candidatus Brachybacterium merdavium]
MATTPVPSPVRIGILGGGGIATAHLNAYATVADRAKVTAIADVDAEALSRREAETGATGYADFKELVKDANVDAVDICLPHHLHTPAILAAAEAGKHILCEKPLCLSPEEATQVSEAVQKAGVTLMCAHNQLFMPAVAKAKEIVDSGALGPIYEVRTTDSFYNDFDPDSMGWRANAATSGGGELIDTGYHPTYLMLHLAGAVPVSAFAMLSTHRLKFMEGEDSAQVLVRFDNGAVGQMVTSWAYMAAPGTDRFSVVGEKGSLSSDGSTLRVHVRGEEEQVFEHESVDTFGAEIAHFVDCLMTGERPINNEVEGVSVLGVILAAYESSKTGQMADVISL